MQDSPIVIVAETRSERIERVLQSLTRKIPGTKGLIPSERANRLHTELERRIAVAKEGLRYHEGD